MRPSMRCIFMTRSILIWSIVALLFGLSAIRAEANDSEECGKASRSPDSAIEACSRLIDHPPGTPFGGKNLAVAYSNRCLARYLKTEFDDAFRDCNEAISLNSQLPTAYNNRGLIWIKLGDFERAIADFSAAIQFNPTFAVALANRCLAYLNKPDPTKAIADCDQAISLSPNLAVAYTERAVAWRMKGDLERSLSDYNAAIRLDPKQVLAFVNRCFTLSAKNENESALNDCNEAIRLNPKFALAYNYRGQVWDAKGEIDHALSDYNAAIRLDQDLVPALKNRGSLYERLKKNDLARADYEAALRVVPRALISKQAQEFVRARLSALNSAPSSPPPAVAERKDVQVPALKSGSNPPPPPTLFTTMREILIPLQIEGGTFKVPVSINNRITLNFVLDSGAADVSIPADVVLTLIRTGTLNAADFLGKQTYRMADGSTVPSQTFRIRSLKVGDKVLENVTGSIASVEGSLLLGQSFLSRLKSWSIDNQRQVLILQ
jgi:tetratricopeptide (TPR) repeat protein